MTKNKNKLTKKDRLKPNRSPRRYATSQMSGAPAGVSQDLQQFTRFYPSSDKGGIRIHTCAAIFDVLKDSVDAGGTALVDTGSNRGVSVQMNPTQPAMLYQGGTKASSSFLSPVFDLLASSFVRYRVRKLIFHYEPQASATDSQRLVFAFANDPMHPVLWNATIPTQAGLLSLADSIAFMPWRAWSMDVTGKLAEQDLFCYSDSSTTVAEFSERFSDFGVISLITSAGGELANATAGVLYMETEIELMEFCPISVTRPASLRILMQMVEDRLKKKESGTYGPPQPTSKANEPSKKDLQALLESMKRGTS